MADDHAPIRTLLITGQTDIHHDWKATSAALRSLLEETGRFEVRVTEEFQGATSATLQSYDLVIVNYFGRLDPMSDMPEARWGEVAEQAIYSFVAEGGGLIAYHATLQMGVDGWGTELEKLCGGMLRPECSRRAPIPDFRVYVRNHDHPITAGMPTSFPHYDDDLYVNLRWHPDSEYEVLLTGWDNPLRYTQVPSEWDALPGMGEEHPVAWVVRYGKGRVLATGLGHGVKAIAHPGFRSLFTRGAEWAGTGVSTLALAEDLGQPSPDGDWWPSELEPKVRANFEARRSAVSGQR
jgi:uncharacterized protein